MAPARRRPSVFLATQITHSLTRALSPPPLRRTTITATTMTIDRTICGGGGGVTLDAASQCRAARCTWTTAHLRRRTAPSRATPRCEWHNTTDGVVIFKHDVAHISGRRRGSCVARCPIDRIKAHFITHLRRRPSVFRATKITHSLTRAFPPPPSHRTTATATTMTIDHTICGGGGGGNVSLDGARGAVYGA